MRVENKKTFVLINNNVSGIFLATNYQNNKFYILIYETRKTTALLILFKTQFFINVGSVFWSLSCYLELANQLSVSQFLDCNNSCFSQFQMTVWHRQRSAVQCWVYSWCWSKAEVLELDLDPAPAFYFYSHLMWFISATKLSISLSFSRPLFLRLQ